MTTKLTWGEFQKIKDIKTLDLEICDYRHLNILNLGKEIWGKWNCEKHEKEHVLCKNLCLPISRNIFGCELVRKGLESDKKPVKTNIKRYLTNCYLCQKELKGAGKHGIIKNRNDPKFWGIGSSYKILCLVCLGKRFYGRIEKERRKMLRKYIKRGYE